MFFSTRGPLLFLGVLCILALLPACDEPALSTPVASERNLFRIGTTQAMKYYDPVIVGGAMVNIHIFAGLVDDYVPVRVRAGKVEYAPEKHLGRTLLIPDERLEKSADGREVVVRLRDWLTFTDGTPVMADDFLFSLAEYKRKMLPHYNIDSSLWPRDVVGEKIDNQTVRLRADHPIDWEIFFSFSLVKPNADYDPTRAGFTNLPYRGIGPYVIKSVDTAHRIIHLTRYERFWRGKPFFENLDIHYVSNSEAMTMALIEDKIDFAPDLTIEDAHVLETAEQFTVLKIPAPFVVTLDINTNAGPLADVRVRKALALLVDREKLVDDPEMNGMQVVPLARYFSLTFDHIESSLGEFDPARAMALFEEAGWRSEKGFLSRKEVQFALTMGYAERDISLLQAREVANLFGDAGIEVTLEKIGPTDRLLARFLAEPGREGKRLDLAMHTKREYRVLENNSRLYVTNSSQNWGGFSDSVVDALFARLRKEPGKSEEIREKLRARFRELTPGIPLYRSTSYAALTGRYPLSASVMEAPYTFGNVWKGF